VPGKNLFTHQGLKSKQLRRKITAALLDSKSTRDFSWLIHK